MFKSHSAYQEDTFFRHHTTLCIRNSLMKMSQACWHILSVELLRERLLSFTANYRNLPYLSFYMVCENLTDYLTSQFGLLVPPACNSQFGLLSDSSSPDLPWGNRNLTFHLKQKQLRATIGKIKMLQFHSTFCISLQTASKFSKFERRPAWKFTIKTLNVIAASPRFASIAMIFLGIYPSSPRLVVKLRTGQRPRSALRLGIYKNDGGKRWTLKITLQNCF